MYDIIDILTHFVRVFSDIKVKLELKQQEVYKIKDYKYAKLTKDGNNERKWNHYDILDSQLNKVKEVKRFKVKSENGGRYITVDKQKVFINMYI